MDFNYEIIRLWERPAAELLAADLGVVPLAVLGRLPADLSVEQGLAAVAQQLVTRILSDAPPDRARKLLTDALLLAGLRIRREVATKIFRGVRVLEESDTYLMIVDIGQEKAMRRIILLLGEKRFGPPDEAVKAELSNITDLDQLTQLALRASEAGSLAGAPGYPLTACQSRI